MDIWMSFFVVLLITVFICLFLGEKGAPSLYKKLKDKFHDLDQVKKGEQFLGEFQDLKVRSLFKMQTSEAKVAPMIFTKFLFYTQLLEDVMRFEKILGVGPGAMLLEIKSSVLSDIKFIRQKQELFRSTYFQMVMMSGLIFFFISSCERYLELNFHWRIYFFIFTWQIIGAGIFYLVSKKREENYFEAYSPWFFLLYRVRLFLKSHLETAEFFESTALELEGIKKYEQKNSFEFERQSFYRVLNHCRDQGLRGDQELVDLTQHLQDKRLFKLDKFQRELAFLKFFILSFFFLVTYLGFVIYLFSFFMD